MKNIIKLSFVACALALLSGCATHNVPTTQTPNYSVGVPRVEVFVDQDGSFYPENWAATYGTPRKVFTWNQSWSLKRAAMQNGKTNELANAQETIVQDIGKTLADKSRVFILVHGFNNDEAEANDAYRLILNQIALADGDAVVEFHWDGLVGKDPANVGTASVWFKACGYSQLAGSEGLRDILNVLKDKHIILIAHSRGSSVVLSALSNPPYFPDFEESTTWLDVNACDPLEGNGNAIDVILLAPAVGKVDFRTVEYYDGNKDFRSLGKQLKSIQYSVNREDPVLEKYINKAGKFNPTDLGYDPTVGECLNKRYKIMTAYDFCDMPVHDFTRYVSHPEFKTMLKACDIPVKE